MAETEKRAEKLKRTKGKGEISEATKPVRAKEKGEISEATKLKRTKGKGGISEATKPVRAKEKGEISEATKLKRTKGKGGISEATKPKQKDEITRRSGRGSQRSPFNRSSRITGGAGGGAKHSHIVARNAALFFGGRDLTSRSNSGTLGLSAEAPEVTAWGDSTRQRLSDSVRDWEFGQEAFYDGAASQIDQLYFDLLAGSGIMGFYPRRSASLCGYEAVGILTEYELEAPVEDAVTVSATIAGSGLLRRMILLETGEATREALAASTALASVDLGGSCVSLDGTFRVFTLAACAGASDPEISASLQHSGDDATWTTLTTWAASVGGYENMKRATSTAACRYRRLIYYLASDESGSAATASAAFMAACGSPQH